MYVQNREFIQYCSYSEEFVVLIWRKDLNKTKNKKPHGKAFGEAQVTLVWQISQDTTVTALRSMDPSLGLKDL